MGLKNTKNRITTIGEESHINWNNIQTLTLIASSLIFSIGICTLLLNLYLKNQKPEKSAKAVLPSQNTRALSSVEEPKPIEAKTILKNAFIYNNPLNEKNNTDNDTYVLIATGDIIPARSVNSVMTKLNNFKYPFEKTQSLLKTGDILFINLEAPLIENCPVTIEGMVFCGSNKSVEGLKYIGTTVANLANNHLGNYGKEGIDNTVKLLNENDIKVTGNDTFSIVKDKDKTFGFLGYNDIGETTAGLSAANAEKVKKEVSELKSKVDFVVVTFHWGTEYTYAPTDRQKELAHEAIDAGADLVIGNHPHWVQGVENYKGKIICYALGNFVFDQMWSQETKEGVIGKFEFNKYGLASIKFFPTIIEYYSQPRFASEKEATKILENIQKASIY